MEAVRLIRNAHHILGLSTGVDIKEIRKRANHLLNLARIEESEKYETDITDMASYRTEQNIKKAVEQLCSIKTRLIEAFFWFETPTLQDFSSLKSISKGEYNTAISYWKNLSANSSNWIAKKNQALAHFISAYHTGNEADFMKSLVLWRDIITSDQFWSFYQEHYKLTDDLGTNVASFNELRTNLFEYLSWLTLDLIRKNPTPYFVKTFFEQTGVVGRGIEDHILASIISKVKTEIDKVDMEKDDSIKLRTKKIAIESALKELSAYGLDEYSPIRVLRENCAKSFRDFSIAAYNDNGDLALSKDFLNSAITISSSDSFQLQAERDKAQLEDNAAFEAFVKNLVSRTKDSSNRVKWDVFLEEEQSLPTHMREEETFLNMKAQALFNFCGEVFQRSLDKLDENGMKIVFEEMWKSLGIFNLNGDKVRELVSEYEKDARANASTKQFQKIDEDDKSVVELSQKIKSDENSKVAFLFLCRSAIWKEAIPYLHYHKFTKNIQTVAFFVGLITLANTTWYLGAGAWIACIVAGSQLGKNLYLKK